MDLTTEYLGLKLPHPFIVGASPLSDTVDAARQVAAAGAAAVVLRSLFEEQIEAETLATHAATEHHTDSFGEASDYLPDHHDFVLGPQAYFDHLREIKDALDIPVIASLNGATPGGWLDHARRIEQAGADALELNVFDIPIDPEQSGQQIENATVRIVEQVRAAVTIPIAVKLGPFYTSLAHLARRLVEAGADGLILFNRAFEPDVDLESLDLTRDLHLSTSAELPLRLRWLGILSAHLDDASLAVTGGVHEPIDALKAIMCGAHAVQIVSAVLRNGPHQITHLRDGLINWLDEHDYKSLAQARGSMNLARCPDPTAYERANYIHMLMSWRAR